jgi:hypothetical protein
MKVKILILCVFAVCASLSTQAWAQSGSSKRLVLNMVGKSLMYKNTVPDIDGDSVKDPAICFDMDLVDGKDGPPMSG